MGLQGIENIGMALEYANEILLKGVVDRGTFEELLYFIGEVNQEIDNGNENFYTYVPSSPGENPLKYRRVYIFLKRRQSRSVNNWCYGFEQHQLLPEKVVYMINDGISWGKCLYTSMYRNFVVDVEFGNYGR